MNRTIGCGIGALIFTLTLGIIIYGFNPWFRPAVVAKKLANPNPTAFVFKSSAAEILYVLREEAVTCCGSGIEFKDNAVFSRDTLKLPGNENDAYIHNFHDSIGPSEIYFARGKPLPYICEFHIHLIPSSNGDTKVEVIPRQPEVIEGQSWWGPHDLSPANIYKSVAPTTIEEYRILLEIGDALGTKNMPPLQLPSDVRRNE